jgi:hypothetical protein
MNEFSSFFGASKAGVTGTKLVAVSLEGSEMGSNA